MRVSWGEGDGAASGFRPRDLRFDRPALFQLSYGDKRKRVVRAARFEHATLCSQSRCSTWLSYARTERLSVTGSDAAQSLRPVCAPRSVSSPRGFVEWLVMQDSNLQPSDLEPVALPVAPMTNGCWYPVRELNPPLQLEGLRTSPEVQRGNGKPSRLCPHATRLVCANQRCVAARDRRPPERTCTPNRPVLVRGHTRDGAGRPGTNPGACQCLIAEPAVKSALRSMQVVKEQALRETSSGAEAAPAAKTKQKARFLAETGPRMSMEGRRLAEAFTR